MTWHAEAEMLEDAIEVNDLAEALKSEGEESRSHAGRWVHRYRDVRVVVNEENQQIITTFRVRK